MTEQARVVPTVGEAVVVTAFSRSQAVEAAMLAAVARWPEMSVAFVHPKRVYDGHALTNVWSVGLLMYRKEGTE